MHAKDTYQPLQIEKVVMKFRELFKYTGQVLEHDFIETIAALIDGNRSYKQTSEPIPRS